MQIEVVYLSDTDDYEFSFQDGRTRKTANFRVNRDDIGMFHSATEATNNHGGYAQGWKLRMSTESDPPPP